jgi:hypothetical protein
VLILTGVAAATVNRLPLWAMLLGAGAFIGAYETMYTTSPTTYVDDSFSVGSALLLGLAVGFAVTSLLGALTEPAPSGVHREGLPPEILPSPRPSAETPAETAARFGAAKQEAADRAGREAGAEAGTKADSEAGVDTAEFPRPWPGTKTGA